MPDAFVEELRRVCEPIFAAQLVALAYLYGSRARGQFTPLSDVDIALVLDPGLTPRERLRLELGLEVALGATTRGEFDVRAINDAPLAVKGTVLQTGKLLFSRDEAFRVRFEARTRSDYFDFLPVLRFHERAFLDAQRADLRRRGFLA